MRTSLRRPRPGTLRTVRRPDLSIDDDPDERYRSEFEARGWQRDIEEAEEQLERNTRRLAEVFIEYMERGDVVEVVVGPQRWVGLVVRVGPELVTVETDSRSVDIPLEHLTLAKVIAPRAEAGRAYSPAQSLTLVARLRELGGASAGVLVELGGADLSSVACSVTAVSASHVELRTSEGESWVVPVRAIGFLVTTVSE